MPDDPDFEPIEITPGSCIWTWGGHAWNLVEPYAMVKDRIAAAIEDDTFVEVTSCTYEGDILTLSIDPGTISGYSQMTPKRWALELERARGAAKAQREAAKAAS